MRFYRMTMIMAVVLLMGKYCSAADIYIAQNTAGSNSGSDCADAHAASWFNSANNWGTGTAQIGPGVTVHVCGTITGSANGTVLTFQGSGSSGAPITLWFESGAIIQAPYCSGAGCIIANNRSYIVIDGNNKTGTVRNTLNGAPGATCPGGGCAYQAQSSLIQMLYCNNCTVQGLHLGPTYIEVQNAGSQNSTNELAIMIHGSNDTVANNVIPDCGWCVNFGQWQNGDVNYQAYGNTFTNFGHAFAMYGADGAVCGPPCSIIHDNVIGPAGTNWDTPQAMNHKDGIHYFGGARHDGAYVYNNWFGGNWGANPTGFIYHDGSPLANIKDNYTFNNVFQVGAGTAGNLTNGWVYGSNDGGGVVYFANNTFIGTGVSDNSLAFAIWASDSFTFTGNIISGVGNPINTAYATKTIIDYNVYNDVCNMGNCYSWNGSGRGSFSGWKAACACEAHSTTKSAALNSDGSLQSNSSARNLEANLTNAATDYLAPLAYDTTNGGQRTPVARPGSGGGNWDAGAFAFGGSAPTVDPPTGLNATVQ